MDYGDRPLDPVIPPSLQLVLLEAKYTSPHSPRLSFLTDQIRKIPVECWNPKGIARDIHDSHHHSRLQTILQELNAPPKKSLMGMFGKKQETGMPSRPSLAEALKKLQSYLDQAGVFLTAVKREQMAINQIDDNRGVLVRGLQAMLDYINTEEMNPEVAEVFRSVIIEKQVEVTEITAIISYAKAAMDMGAQSLREGRDHAMQLMRAVEASLGVSAPTSDMSIKAENSRIFRSGPVIDPNRIKPLSPREIAQHELDRLERQVRASLENHQNAIAKMDVEMEKAAQACRTAS